MVESERVAVVGTTSWGTTLAVLLARKGYDVRLWARTEAEAEELAQAGENARRRPGLRFPQTLRVLAGPQAFAGAELVVLAVPSRSLRENLARVLPAVDGEATVLSAIKGIEPESGRRMSEVIAGEGVAFERILVLSGPNFSAEIAAGLPAATVVAGVDAARARRVQALLMGPTFRVYTSVDVVGVELGGALKNVVAICCGLSDGLAYGENAKAALITRALAEIARLGVACGARALTFLGLAGIGDLTASCYSNLSRNRRVGLELAAGKGLEEAVAAVGGTAEGVVTTVAVRDLARRLGVEMPICDGLYSVLYEGIDPRTAVTGLMLRAAKEEFAGFPAV